MWPAWAEACGLVSNYYDHLLLFLGRIAVQHRWSVRQSACTSVMIVSPAKWLNRSRCRFGCGLGRNHVLDGVQILSITFIFAVLLPDLQMSFQHSQKGVEIWEIWQQRWRILLVFFTVCAQKWRIIFRPWYISNISTIWNYACAVFPVLPLPIVNVLSLLFSAISISCKMI